MSGRGAGRHHDGSGGPAGIDCVRRRVSVGGLPGGEMAFKCDGRTCSSELQV